MVTSGQRRSEFNGVHDDGGKRFSRATSGLMIIGMALRVLREAFRSTGRRSKERKLIKETLKIADGGEELG